MYASIAIALIIFIVGMIVVNFIGPELNTTRTSLQCSSASTISDGTKIMCLAIDTTVIYWMILIFSLAGGLILEHVLI